MTDAFADLVTPLFQRVIDLQDHLAWGEARSLEEVKQLTRSWVESTEQRASVDSTLASDFTLARFALVAWIDEVLTDSDWGKSVGWGSEDHMLEWDLFRTRLRADRFYEWAHRAEGENALDPLETYLLCVALGFRGKYRFNEGAFGQWVEHVYARVASGGSVASKPFPEDAEGDAPTGLQPLAGPALLVRVSALVSVTAMLTLIAYLWAVTYSFARY